MKIDSYLAGLLYGDGTCHIGKNRAYAVWIDQHEKNKDILNKAIEKFKKLDLKVHHYGFLNKFRALVYSKELFFIFKEMRNNIEKFFSELSEKEKFNFIAGFFDAEGTVTDRLVIYNSNTKLLKLIQDFLNRKEIKSYIYKFGKIFGLQIYRKSHVLLFKENISSVKIQRSISSV